MVEHRLSLNKITSKLVLNLLFYFLLINAMLSVFERLLCCDRSICVKYALERECLPVVFSLARKCI